MKEIAISAAAVVGLFGFAALYNNGQANRVRRDIFDVEIDEDIEDPFNTDAYGFHSSLDNITTDGWKVFFEEAGIHDAQLIEDVQTKNRQFARVNFNAIDNMIPAFLRENARRQAITGNFLAARGSNLANDNPAVLANQQDNGQSNGDSVNYYDGVSNTHPKIERLLEETGWSDASPGLDMDSHSSMQVWFMFPAAVPLFYESGAQAISSFHSYWKFVMRFKNRLPMDRTVRISVGLWAKGAVFTPRGSKLHARLPWTRIERYYKRARATASQPFIMTTVDTLTQYTKGYGPSGSNAGVNCVVFWFHHDWAADVSKMVTPQGYDKIRQLNGQCTILHTFVGMGGKSQENLDYLNMLVPSLSSRVAIDSDYNQGFFVDTIEELDSETMVRRYFAFLRIITTRQYCRIFRGGWSPPPTESELTMIPNTDGPGWEATDASEVAAPEYNNDGDESYDFSGTAAPTYDTYASEVTEGTGMRGVDDEDTTPKVPEIDGCCGHTPEGTPFDSELRVCCEDGSTKPHDEYDPCTMGTISGFY